VNSIEGSALRRYPLPADLSIYFPLLKFKIVKKVNAKA